MAWRLLATDFTFQELILFIIATIVHIPTAVGHEHIVSQLRSFTKSNHYTNYTTRTFPLWCG